MSEGTDAALFPWEQEAAGQAPAAPGDASDSPAAAEAEAAVADAEPAAQAPPAVGAVPVADAEPAAQAPPAVGAVPVADAESAAEAKPAADAESAHVESASRRGPVVRKEYYSISEVADLVALPAHVLRYWESQFSVLNPSKNRSGNRVYQRKEIRLILLVKQLLYDEKYTVEGAKQKLDQLRRGGEIASATVQALDTQMVQVLRDELRTLSEVLAPDDA